jgi:hypothetical protein
MPNVPQGTAANVLVGSARLLVAPIGTALPTLDGTVDPVTFAAAWKEVGYTDGGCTLAYQAGIKDITVDEEMAPVKKILDTEKGSITCVLAESTLTNMDNAIAAAILTKTAGDATHARLETLDVGSGTLTENMIALEGKNQAGKQRIIIGYRSVPEANVSMSFKRGDKTMIPVTFGLIADPTQVAGKRLFKMVDLTGPIGTP